MLRLGHLRYVVEHRPKQAFADQVNVVGEPIADLPDTDRRFFLNLDIQLLRNHGQDFPKISAVQPRQLDRFEYPRRSLSLLARAARRAPACSWSAVRARGFPIERGNRPLYAPGGRSRLHSRSRSTRPAARRRTRGIPAVAPNPPP